MSQRDAGPVVRPGEEWVGALVTLPSYVTGEGEPYRPVLVMWIDAASRYIVDTVLVRPDEALARAAGLFVQATREPKEGPPHTPERLRVSDAALAAALRGQIGDVEVVVAATPELDEVVASMAEYFAGPGREEPEQQTFIGPDMSPRDVAALFAAAARMYRAAPWRILPPDVCIGVSCDVLGIADGAMVVVGQMGHSYGFSLFASMDKTLAFYEAVEAHERGEKRPAVPGHLMFGYDARDELPAELLREVAAHGWDVASPKAYPSPTVLDDDGVARGVTRVEMLGVAAIMTALSELVETEPRLAEAWERADRAITWKRTVPTPLGSVGVELRMPVLLPLDGSIAKTDSLLDEDGELDEDMLEHYAEILVDELERVSGVPDMLLQCADMLILHAGQRFGVPLLHASPQALDQLLFEHIPAQVAIEPDVAPFVIDAARRLMTLGAEKLGIEAARECLASLAAPDLATRLADALADESRYSRAKAMILQGIREGYDMTSERGIEAWIEELARRAQPPERKGSAGAKPTKSAKPPKSAKPAARAKKAPAKTKPKPKAAKKTRSGRASKPR